MADWTEIQAGHMQTSLPVSPNSLLYYLHQSKTFLCVIFVVIILSKIFNLLK